MTEPYLSDLDLVKSRIREQHARAEFGPPLLAHRDPLAEACEYAAKLEGALAVAIQEHHRNDDMFFRLYRAWESVNDVRAALCIDEPPTERPAHVHDATCRDCRQTAGEADAFVLPSPAVPHPRGGNAWPVAVELEACGEHGFGVGAMTELPPDYTDDRSC